MELLSQVVDIKTLESDIKILLTRDTQWWVLP